MRYLRFIQLMFFDIYFVVSKVWDILLYRPQLWKRFPFRCMPYFILIVVSFLDSYIITNVFIKTFLVIYLQLRTIQQCKWLPEGNFKHIYYGFPIIYDQNILFIFGTDSAGAGESVGTVLKEIHSVYTKFFHQIWSSHSGLRLHVPIVIPFVAFCNKEKVGDITAADGSFV